MTDQNLNQPQKEGESVEQKKNVLLDSMSTKFIKGGGILYCWVVPVPS